MLPAGYAATLRVTASGTGPLVYQWARNGVAIPGATGATYAFAKLQLSDSGAYSVVVTNAVGSVTSNAVTVAVGSSAGKFFNLSTRGFVGAGDNTLIAGFVIDGTTPKSVLIRAVGPGLAQYGLGAAQVLADPVLTVKDAEGNDVCANDDWGAATNAASLPQAFDATGAFDLLPGSKDAVVLATLAPGIYTALVRGKDSATGLALLEMYEVP
jgi:hypothetical protein